MADNATEAETYPPAIYPDAGLIGSPRTANVDALLNLYEAACHAFREHSLAALGAREELTGSQEKLAELEATAALSAQDGPNREWRAAAAKKRLAEDELYQTTREARDESSRKVLRSEVEAEVQRRAMQGLRAAMFALAGTQEDEN